VAAKTGTTNDFRDNWTLGYTPDLVTGVWIGNADYTPMVNTTGLTGAAPIWSSFMQFAVPYVSPNNIPTPFTIPPGIVEYVICTTSGTEPSQGCRGGQRSEYFASDQPPLPKSQDLIRNTPIDTWTGLIAGNACPDFAKEESVLNVQDKWARQWLRSGDGRAWLESNDLPRNPFFAPERECSGDDPRPVLEFQNPQNGNTITETILPISAVIDVRNGGFTGWRLEYGEGQDPDDWTVLNQGNQAFPQPGLIHTWDLTGVTSNVVTLRLYLMNGEDFYAEKRVTIGLNLPVPTETPTSTPTTVPPTAFPTDTSIPPVIASPTETLTPFPSPTFTETATTAPTP
jgi:hypothetical protein